MMSDSEDTFGFELLYNTSAEQIARKEDVLILFVHWYFLKNGFKCLGVGDSKTIAPTEVGSELLPNGWNQTPNYTLRYIRDGKLYILMGIKSEDDLLLNLLKIEDHSVSNVQFPIDTVKELQGPLKSLIPNYETLFSTLKQDLVLPMFTRGRNEMSTQTSQSELDRQRRDDDDPLRVRLPERPDQPIPVRDPMRVPMIPPFDFGQDDLNPLHGTGRGGMLFDPFSNRGTRPPGPYPGLGIPGRLPPGAIQPGARFDPFGPPDIEPPRPTRNPDADHLPPPGYDDMFM